MRALLRLVLIFYLYVRVRLHWAQRGRRDSAEDRLHRANQSLGAVEMSMTAEAAKEGTNTGTTLSQAKAAVDCPGKKGRHGQPLAPR